MNVSACRRQRDQGYLDIEEKPLSGNFTARYFHLNKHEKKLNYYKCEDIPKSESGFQKPSGFLDMRYVSEVNCCSKSRPKVTNCFSITVSGERTYLRTSSQREKEEWIEALRNITKITVPKNEVSQINRNSDLDSEAGYETTVVAGVIVRKLIEQEEESGSSCEELSHFYTHESIIKSGYCVKQGAVMRSWKRRYFVLDSTGLTYYKSDVDHVPLRSVSKFEIIEARISRGVHPTRENLFEVVTEQRVFYIQAESIKEMHSWVEDINLLVQRKRQKTPVDQSSQTSLSLVQNVNKLQLYPDPKTQPSMSTWL